MIVGNLLALRQDNVKRIFAYSSISQIGFILLAIGIGLFARQYSGFYSGLLHLLNHALMKALAFLTVGTVIYTRLNKSPAIYICDLKGLAGRDSVTAFALVIACLSLAGIPPLAGFMSKFQIFAAGLETQNPTLALLVIFAALNSVLSLAYCFPIMNALFQPSGRPKHRAIPAAMHIPLVILTGLVIVLGIAPPSVDGLIAPATDTLMRLFGG
jgi:formate hydrogenlyase subunit 3/multisubunit Na+/H+ antiporter MnhD subunit